MSKTKYTTQKMKFKLDKWLDNDSCKQIAILPHINFWWNTNNSHCLSIGWLVWDFQFWFGNVENVN